MPWAGPGYRSDLADECGRGQNSLRRRLEALGWSRLALPSPDDQSGTIAHQRAVVEIQGWSTHRVGHRTRQGCKPRWRPGKRRPPYGAVSGRPFRRVINASRWPPNDAAAGPLFLQPLLRHFLAQGELALLAVRVEDDHRLALLQGA